MNSPTTIPYRFKTTVAIALPACALIFLSWAHIVIDGSERDSSRMVRTTIEAMAKRQAALAAVVYAKASVQLYALTLNPVFLEPYKEALARRQSFEHAWDKTAVRNTFAGNGWISSEWISSDRKPASSSAVRIWSSITWTGKVSWINSGIGQ
jgi:hypothetical protein